MRFLEPAKRPDDRADYCMDCSSPHPPSASTGYSFLQLSGVGRTVECGGMKVITETYREQIGVFSEAELIFEAIGSCAISARFAQPEIRFDSFGLCSLFFFVCSKKEANYSVTVSCKYKFISFVI